MFIIAFYFLSFSLNSNSYSLDIFLVFYSLFLVYLFIFLSYNIIFHFFHKFTKFLVHLFLCTCLCWGNGTFLVSEFLRQGSFSYPQVIAWLCVPVFCFFLNQGFFFSPLLMWIEGIFPQLICIGSWFLIQHFGMDPFLAVFLFLFAVLKCLVYY